MTVEILRAAKALLDTPDKWWDGTGLAPQEQNCMVMAVTRAALRGGVEDLPVLHVLARAVGCLHVHTFNDTRTHAEVMAAFDRAIEVEEAKAQEFTVTREPVAA